MRNMKVEVTLLNGSIFEGWIKETILSPGTIINLSDTPELRGKSLKVTRTEKRKDLGNRKCTYTSKFTLLVEEQVAVDTEKALTRMLISTHEHWFTKTINEIVLIAPDGEKTVVDNILNFRYDHKNNVADIEHIVTLEEYPDTGSYEEWYLDTKTLGIRKMTTRIVKVQNVVLTHVDSEPYLDEEV